MKYQQGLGGDEEVSDNFSCNEKASGNQIHLDMTCHQKNTRAQVGQGTVTPGCEGVGYKVTINISPVYTLLIHTEN